MSMRDIRNGPIEGAWVVLGILFILSIVLLSGHGKNLIAGYHSASEEKKKKIDEKKLCRVTGAGVLVVAVLILFTLLGEAVLPASFAYFLLGAILLDVLVMLILANTICKK